MASYTTPEDIANRALSHCRRDHIVAFTDQTEEANEIGFHYDKLRQAELRRNVWRFAIRRNILRAVSIDTQEWTPPTYAAGTTYSLGGIVIDVNGELWQSKVGSNVGHTPEAGSAYWRRYFGPITTDLYDSSTTYYSGEIVIVPAAWDSGTTYAANAVVRSSTTWYVSLQGSNLNNAVSDTTYWTEWTNTGRGDSTFGVTASGAPIPLTFPGTPAIYLSLYNGNTDNPLDATGNWLALNGTLSQLAIVYPIGTGPVQQLGTSNVYRLPSGFLRRAPSDPHGGLNPWLGGPSGPAADDWLLEGNYIVSADLAPIMLRYVADMVDVADMDPMFCEGLAARIAREAAPVLARDGTLNVILSDTKAMYRDVMREARVVNGIEEGPTDAAEDEYITVRR